MGTLCWVLLMLTLALPAQAIAQQGASESHPPFRKWDTGGGVGIRFGEGDDAVVRGITWMAEAGRYWTAHLKTSVAVTTAGQTSGDYFSTRSAFGSTVRTTRPAAYSGSVVYQFFDNVFVHSYVSAGARFAASSAVTKTYSALAPYALLSTDTTPTRTQLRPVIGGGFKSYFANGRAFMRSELLLAVDPYGSHHAVLQIGAGVDF